MQLLEHWDPLNLPRGSIRALVTLSLLGILWALMLLERPVPLPLCFVILLVVGHYFGARGTAPAGAGRSPLYLPRGSVRTIIVLGFGAVGYFLWSKGNLALTLADTSSAVFLMVAALLAGFLLRKFFDVIFRGKAVKPRRWFENLKAVVVLVATALLGLVCFTGAEDPKQQNLALIAAPLVVFYFGSRN